MDTLTCITDIHGENVKGQSNKMMSVQCVFAHNLTTKSRISNKIGQRLSTPQLTFHTNSKVKRSRSPGCSGWLFKSSIAVPGHIVAVAQLVSFSVLTRQIALILACKHFHLTMSKRSLFQTFVKPGLNSSGSINVCQ